MTHIQKEWNVVLLKYVFYMIGFDLSSLEMCFITFFFFYLFRLNHIIFHHP